MTAQDKNDFKSNLAIEQVLEYVNYLGGNGYIVNDNIAVFKTVCHHSHDELSEANHKLYYYNNSHLFKCFTQCSDEDGFDIYQLTKKVKERETGINWSFNKCYSFVKSFFGYPIEEIEFSNVRTSLEDWNFFEKYNKIKDRQEFSQIVELPKYDKKILRYIPTPRILNWEEEGISKEEIKRHNIKYDPVRNSIIIPHYDIDGELIGIRARTLVKEKEKYGKYLPAILNNKMYNHPLSFALYNLNNSKVNIKAIRKAVVFESEKSCMQFSTMFSKENDISVAVCGSNLTFFQIKLLLSLGVEEIVLAFDKQYKSLRDKEWELWTTKLRNIYKKYNSYIGFSFIFDTGNLLDYKDSPVDKSKEIFLELFKNRIYL
jgi:hypothetical protein